VARVSAQLERVGGSSGSLAGISLRSAPIHGEEGLVRQTAEIRLTRLDAGATARFLSAWKETEPLWTVAAVRLQHSGRNSSDATSESFDVRLTLESVHWSRDSPAREGNPT